MSEYNRTFEANGVTINAPRQVDRVLVYDKAKYALGEKSLIALDRPQDFDPRYHVKIKQMVAEKTTSAPSSNVESAARWKELQDKGWSALKGEERAEYQNLKAIYGQD